MLNTWNLLWLWITFKGETIIVHSYKTHMSSILDVYPRRRYGMYRWPFFRPSTQNPIQGIHWSSCKTPCPKIYPDSHLHSDVKNFDATVCMTDPFSRPLIQLHLHDNTSKTVFNAFLDSLYGRPHSNWAHSQSDCIFHYSFYISQLTSVQYFSTLNHKEADPIGGKQTKSLSRSIFAVFAIIGDQLLVIRRSRFSLDCVIAGDGRSWSSC